MITEDQVSAGGVAYRERAGGYEIALVLTPPKNRWQLPKGLVDAGEMPEETAVREVREEAGIETELIAPLDTIEYWYVGTKRGQRVRFHKFVHFFLLNYLGGEIRGDGREVLEARWVPIDEAQTRLAFKNEQAAVAQARTLLASK